MYQHIFFDLDHTLWDHERCSAETLKDLYQKYELQSFVPHVSSEQFLMCYLDITHQLWQEYDQHRIDQQTLRSLRLTLLSERLEEKVPYEILKNIAEEYIETCPLKTYLMPFAREILAYLSQKNYRLHIITNGFAEIQAQKLKSSGIISFFEQIITSDSFGFRKPSPEIFHHTFQKITAHPNQCLMIGDNLETDIQGAKNVALDHIFYNPSKKVYEAEVQCEIHCLSELQAIL